MNNHVVLFLIENGLVNPKLLEAWNRHQEKSEEPVVDTQRIRYHLGCARIVTGIMILAAVALSFLIIAEPLKARLNENLSHIYEMVRISLATLFLFLLVLRHVLNRPSKLTRELALLDARLGEEYMLHKEISDINLRAKKQIMDASLKLGANEFGYGVTSGAALIARDAFADTHALFFKFELCEEKDRAYRHLPDATDWLVHS